MCEPQVQKRDGEQLVPDTTLLQEPQSRGVERPGFTTITTPIDALVTAHLVPFLQTHGATVEVVTKGHQYLAHLPSGRRRIRTYHVYRITFPTGMRRLDGLSTLWMVPFTLIFPDGARLEGRINYLSQPEEIVLGLPS